MNTWEDRYREALRRFLEADARTRLLTPEDGRALVLSLEALDGQKPLPPLQTLQHEAHSETCTPVIPRGLRPRELTTLEELLLAQQEVTVGFVSASCTCGALRSRVALWRGPLGELLRGITRA